MQPGQSIFSADLWSARSRLAHLEWIASAEIHRRYPDAIFVTLVEKRPFALWQAPVNAKGEAPIFVVERNGNPITSHEVEKFRRLPKLVGEGAPASRRRSGRCGGRPSRHRGADRRLSADFQAPLEPDPG